MTDVVTGLGPQWEARVATTLEQVRGVTVIRRCADTAELVAVAQAGLGEVAVVSSDLRGLDLTVVRRLVDHGIRLVGIDASPDESGERRLRQLGIQHVVGSTAQAAEFDAAVTAAIEVSSPSAGGPAVGRPAPPAAAEAPQVHDLPTGADASSVDIPDFLPDFLPTAPAGATRTPTPPQGGNTSHASLDGAGWLPSGADVAQEPTGPATAPRSGTIVGVWGPTGAPGRTTVAVNLAAELASRGTAVLLVDADTYGGSVAQLLGLLDEAPGVAAACRAADQGTLDLPGLARLAPVVTSGLRVLTGLPKAERWPEVRGAAFERVLELSRSLAAVVVVDCGFSLEDDEELSYDTTAPRRNESTLTALELADSVLAVGGADPVGLQRFVRGLQELGTVPSPPPVPVINRVRASAVGSRPESRIADSLLRFAGLESVRFVPDDQAVVDAAVLAGRTVVEHAPDSAFRAAVQDLADHVAPWSRSRSRATTSSWRRRGAASPAPA